MYTHIHTHKNKKPIVYGHRSGLSNLIIALR